MYHGHIPDRVHTKDLAQVPISQPQKPRIFTIQRIFETIWVKGTIFERGGQHSRLSASVIKTWQQKIGCLLFYGRNVYMMLLVALITLLSTQSNVIEETAQAMMQLLNYCTTYPDAFIRYKTIDMIL